MLKKVCVLVIFILFSCKKIPQNTKESQIENKTISLADSLTNELKEIHNQGHINGFSVAIVNQDKLLYQNGFGYSDIISKKQYSSNTIQNIASISKTLIGIALLKAQEMNKLKLDDPVNKYLPFKVINPNHPNIEITIRHLATHTSSIKDTEFYGNKAYVLKEDVVLSKQIEAYYVKLNNYISYFCFKI